MDLNKFKRSQEKPIYRNLEELYKTADLSSDEIEIFNKYKKISEYWLLRSKRQYANSLNDSPNFIQKVARVLINLQSSNVTGSKDKLVQEMFGDKSIHRCYKTKTGVRSTINSNKLFNTYFELEILSFFLENNFNISLSKSDQKGQKIPEFVASIDSLRINVEAKQMDIDKIMDNIFGDSFINGFDYTPSEEERQKGYKKIRSAVEGNYVKAMQKYFEIPTNEYFVLFLSAYYKISHMGQATVDFLNKLQNEWIDSKFDHLIGIVMPEENNTFFIKSPRCELDLSEHINILNYHNYNPSIIK